MSPLARATRGILLDVAALREVPWLEPGEGVFPEDLGSSQAARLIMRLALLLGSVWFRARCPTTPPSAVPCAEDRG